MDNKIDIEDFDPATNVSESSDAGYFCISCEEYKMFLSENELVYECRNCGHWEYSSS